MAGSIGKLNLQLSANPSQFLNDLARAEAGLKHLSDERKIQEWARLNTSALTKMGRAAASSLGNLGVSAAKGVASSAVGGIGKIASSGVGAITGVVADLFGPESVFNTIKDLDKTAALADSLNIDVEELTALQYAARKSGVDVEALNKGLRHLEKSMAGATVASETGGRSLESFNVDSKALRAQLPSDAFDTLADRTKDLAAGIDRAGLSTSGFGKAGQELLPLLSKGSAEIKRLKEEARDYGQVLTSAQAGEVAKAREAVTEVEQAYAGLKKQIAIGLSPLISDAASGFKEWLSSIGGVEGAAKALLNVLFDISEVLVGVVKSVSDLVGDIKTLPSRAGKGVLNAIGGFALNTVGGLTPGLGVGASAIRGSDDAGLDMDKIKAAAGDLTNWLSAHGVNIVDVPKEKSGIDKVLDLLKRGRAGVDLIGSGPKATLGPWGDFLNRQIERQKELKTASEGLTESLRKQIATFGLSEAEIKRNDLVAAGASTKQLQSVNEQLDKLEKLKHSQEQFQTAAAIVDSNTNFAESFIEELEQLDDLLKSGKLGLEQWGRAATKATGKFLDAGGMVLGLPSGLQQGSAEAISAVARAEQASQKGTQNPVKLVEDLLKSLNDIQRQQLAILQQQAAEAGGPVAKLIPER